jgi:hypothetical protein
MHRAQYSLQNRPDPWEIVDHWIDKVTCHHAKVGLDPRHGFNELVTAVRQTIDM